MNVEEKIKEIENALNRVQNLAEDVVVCLEDIIPQKIVYIPQKINQSEERVLSETLAVLIRDCIKNIDEAESGIEKEKWVEMRKELQELLYFAGTL